MILSQEQIIEKIKNPTNKYLIEHAVKIKKQHELHVVGLGINSFINKIDGVENDEYVELRKRFADYYTVKVFEKAIMPMSKLWNAKGSVKSFVFDNDKDSKLKRQLLEHLEYPKNGSGLKTYLEKQWGDYGIWVDPLGLNFIKIDEDGDLFIDYISVYDRIGKGIFINIHDISFKSIDNIDYVILNIGADENGNYQYKIIDEAYEYIAIKDKDDSDKITIIQDEIYENIFGIVPAVINSNRVDKKIKGGVTTYCYESIPIANDCLSDMINNRIYKLKLGIPKFWEFATECTHCNGIGEIHENENVIRCDYCQGTGKDTRKVLTDIMRVDLLEKDVQNYIPPAGAVTLPIDIEKLQLSEIADMQRDIIETIWGDGSTVDKDRKNTTAFEISVRSDQKLSKLESIDKNRVIVEKFIIDIYGKYYFKEKFKYVEIKSSNQYILTSAAEAWEIYIDAKEKGATNYQLDKLYIEYIESEYENNVAAKDRQLKLMLLNPMPHYNILEAKDLLTEEELNIKKNFERYIYIYEKKNSLLENSITDIYESLKKISNGTFS